MQKTLNSGEDKTFLWNKIIWYAFYSKFATFNDFEKHPKFERFEKPYYFSRILRKSCNNMLIKFLHAQNCQTSDTFPHHTFSIGKNVIVQFQRFDWMIFFHIKNLGKK